MYHISTLLWKIISKIGVGNLSSWLSENFLTLDQTKWHFKDRYNAILWRQLSTVYIFPGIYSYKPSLKSELLAALSSFRIILLEKNARRNCFWSTWNKHGIWVSTSLFKTSFEFSQPRKVKILHRISWGRFLDFLIFGKIRSRSRKVIDRGVRWNLFNKNWKKPFL